MQEVSYKPKIAIVIPCYEMKGYGVEYLKFSIDKIIEQTYDNWIVIISDHSVNNEIENLILNYNNSKIFCYKNDYKRGNSSANTNYGIQKASEKDVDYIKILFQDDYFYHIEALEEIIQKFLENDGASWLVSGCCHSNDGINVYRPMFPSYNNEIHLGNNTISSPSVLTIVNQNDILFDENLIWLMDCEYYKQLYDEFDLPLILKDINVVNRITPNQVSNSIITPEIIKKEEIYVKQKYNLI